MGAWGDRRLESRYDRSREQAAAAAAQGRHADALEHSRAALDAVRTLQARHPDDARHHPVLAAALYNHGGRLLATGAHDEALVVLREAAQRYEDLGRSDPSAYTVPRIDVTLRIGQALADAGRAQEAHPLLREAVERYPDAPTNDLVERALGLVRAWTALGICLSALGRYDEALEAADQALFTAERTREEAGISPLQYDWLARAGTSFQNAARQWMSAAVYAMERHARAGRWGIAADAANIAVRVAAGLAALPGSALGDVYQLLLARAQSIWAVAEGSAPAATADQQRSPAILLLLHQAGWRLPS